MTGNPCLHQNTNPGDLFPPTCNEPRGHPGNHQARSQLGTDRRINWPNTDTQQEPAA